MNLRGIWAVFRKEFRDNLRDKRTLLSALVFGPVISPILVAALVQFGISRAETQSDENIPRAVMHAERVDQCFQLGLHRPAGIGRQQVRQPLGRGVGAVRG